MTYLTAPGILQPRIELDSIDRAAAKVWGLDPPELIYKKTRARYIVEPRQAAQYYKVEVLNIAPMQLEKKTDWDHSTINHSCKTVNGLLKTTKKFKTKYNEFLNEIENGKNNLHSTNDI